MSSVLVAVLLECVVGFVVTQPTRVVLPFRAAVPRLDRLRRQDALKMAEDEDDDASSPDSPKRKRKRKRKQGEEQGSEASTSLAVEKPTDPVVELKPRNYNPVQMQVADVRDVVSGTSTTRSTDNKASPAVPTSQKMASTSSSPSGPSISTPSSSMDDSLQQLLEDAKRMQQLEETTEEEGSNVKATLRNVLGNIVTADFFVVCAFLLWFLVGIFCSSVLKDDTIQIAFNSKYLEGRGGIFYFTGTLSTLTSCFRCRQLSSLCAAGVGDFDGRSGSGKLFKRRRRGRRLSVSVITIAPDG